MVNITQLRVVSECHTVEFATLCGTIAYLQCGIRWMHEHQDYDDDEEFDYANDGDGTTAEQLLGISFLFVTKEGEYLWIDCIATFVL